MCCVPSSGLTTAGSTDSAIRTLALWNTNRAAWQSPVSGIARYPPIWAAVALMPVKMLATQIGDSALGRRFPLTSAVGAPP